jgi:hypothetical protein
MHQPTLNADCKSEGCPGFLLIASPILPGERRSLICRICRERHEYGPEDVYDSGTKLEIRIGR